MLNAILAGMEEYARTHDGDPGILAATNAEFTAGQSGEQLHRLLMLLGLFSSLDCDCAGHIEQMNRSGVAWCRLNLATIVGWLREAAEHRGMTYIESQARWIVELAITLTEENREPSRPERVRLRAMKIGNRLLNGSKPSSAAK